MDDDFFIKKRILIANNNQKTTKEGAMKGLKASILMMGLISTSASFASVYSDKALKLIPEGTVQKEEKGDVNVLTKNKTIVEVEFDRNGELKEAKGGSVKLDNFVPENGMLSLKDAHAKLESTGAIAVGEWSLDHSRKYNWHYEFEVLKDNVKFDYVLDARTGKVLDTYRD